MLGDYLPIHQVPRQGLDDSERIADQRVSVYKEVVIGPWSRVQRPESSKASLMMRSYAHSSLRAD